MDKKNQRKDNERILWHGTSMQNEKAIIENGLSSNYSGNTFGRYILCHDTIRSISILQGKPSVGRIGQFRRVCTFLTRSRCVLGKTDFDRLCVHRVTLVNALSRITSEILNF